MPFLTDSLEKIKNIKVINNKLVNYKGVRIGGLGYFIDTCWVREFKPLDYRERLASAKKVTDKSKKTLKNFGNIDILLCHQPPYGILDKVGIDAPKPWRGKHAGSKAVLDYIHKKHPAYVFCGHIHKAEGSKKIGRTKVHNLGVCGYKIINIP